MDLETRVAGHYSGEGMLARIDAALAATGLDPADPGYDAIKALDELHTGGAEATAALLDPLGIGTGTEAIDLGCGIGGAARHMAHRYGARVRGIDLTPDFIATGRVLTERLGLSDRVELTVGSVLELPYDDASADLVTLLHVGMNIADKARLFAEAARVLRPGGRVAIYDVMRGDSAEALLFPLPWAREVADSHVEPPGVYRRAGHAAGLTEVAERDRRDFAVEFHARTARRIAVEGPPKLGPHLVMGSDMKERLASYAENVAARRCHPVEMILTKAAR